MVCPKCAYERKPTDVECPKCGIVYEKWEGYTAQEQAENETKREGPQHTDTAEKYQGSGGRTSNREIMAQARESLRGNWVKAIGALLIFGVVTGVPGSVLSIGGLISLLIAGAMNLGLSIFALSLSRRQDPAITDIFLGFKNFWVALGAYLLLTIFIILWSILLIVPGVIATLRYSMTFYIIAENDSIGPLEAITKSKKIMYGNKWKLFCFSCRFLGWAVLCVITLGIGFLWLAPYISISFARFYDDIAV